MAFKLAIIGAGPSAFYAAARLFKNLPELTFPSLRIHVFDRLWSPHGLVRYGVAPDHPEVKNCTNKFDEVAKDSRFRFFGNVNIGSTNPIPHAVSLPLACIFKNYSHVLFATGCALPKLHGDLQPSEYCMPASSIVQWYTSHPNAPPPPPLHKISHLSIIGHGNVSLDVARIFLKNVRTLSKYDVSRPVLDVLSTSKVRHISIIGRRGPLEVAFTSKELREMMSLPQTYMVPLHPSLTKPPNGQTLTRQQLRILKLLSDGSEEAKKPLFKSWSLEFFRSPVGFASRPSICSSRHSLLLAHTAVDPKSDDKRAIPTGQNSILKTDFVVTSLGFHAEPMESELYDPVVGHLRNASGRVITAEGKTMKNVYASGWAATGAKGVLASTMLNAFSVADMIVADWTTGSNGSAAPLSSLMNEDPDINSLPEDVERGLQDGVVVQYKDWKMIDLEERFKGSIMGKERERICWEDARNVFTNHRSTRKPLADPFQNP